MPSIPVLVDDIGEHLDDAACFDAVSSVVVHEAELAQRCELGGLQIDGLGGLCVRDAILFLKNKNKNGIGDTLWENPTTGQNVLQAVKAVDSVTLSDSSRIRLRTEVLRLLTVQPASKNSVPLTPGGLTNTEVFLSFCFLWNLTLILILIIRVCQRRQPAQPPAS